MRPLVIDTNIALDLLVFRDASTVALQQALAEGRLRWIATSSMRGEFERVLGYAPIAARLALLGATAQQMLGAFDRHACLVDAAPRAPLDCSDPDDQGFIDLAVQHACILLSKDAAVLALRPRLAALQVTAGPVLPLSSYSLSQR